MVSQDQKDIDLFSGKRILVASSNEQLALYFRNYLFDIPTVEVDTARNVGIAMLRIMEKSYDAIILDSDLMAVDSPTEFFYGAPEQSRPAGLELLRFLRHNCTGSRAETKTLMVVSNPNFERVIDARNSGANEIVAMPLSMNVVISRMRAMMNSKKPFIRSRGYVGPCRRMARRKIWAGEERRLGGLPLRSKVRPISEVLEAV